MKIPLNWLRDYVPLALPPARLIERLTLAGLEVAQVRVLGLPTPEGVRVKAEDRGPIWDRDKIFVAEVLRVDKHPDADRLKLPTVTWGEGTIKQLVTGAPNINVGDQGQKVVLALRGSVLLDGHSAERKLIELKPTKIRGVPSDAMVCSMLELGLSEEHEGIILLEQDAPVGMPLADFMGDIVLEVDVLPNMARCLSLIGVAREVAAITGETLKLPSIGVKTTSEPIEGMVQVEIENPTLSARYAAAIIKDVTLGPAPGWMQRRLLYADMRPINNIVDITNYAMLEWGQPLHAFDYDVLVARAEGKAPTIRVRPARSGEVLATLDGQKRELGPDNLVIADTQGPIALAGVMGGLETEVTARTKNILLESASFDMVSIRRTMKQFNLPSEASVRFSKGIHPELVRPALARATELMRQHAGGAVCAGVVDNYPAPMVLEVVELSLGQVSKQLGMDFPRDEAIRILKALEFDVSPAGPETLRVVVPPHRLDVQVGAADLIEEIVRIYGYDRLPETLLADRLPRQRTNEALVFEEKVRDLLVNCGLQEVVTYALTMPEKETPLKPPAEKPGVDAPQGNSALGVDGYVTLLNPISSERTVLRRELLPGVLEVAERNLRHTGDLRLFEVGPVYLPRAGQPLPEEPRRIALVLIGRREAEFWGEPSGGGEIDFSDLQGLLEMLAGGLQLNVKVQPSKAPYLHPHKAAMLVTGDGRNLGDFGQLHPKVAEAYRLGSRAVFIAELDLEAVQSAASKRFNFAPISPYPAALRDIAVVVDEAISGERVSDEIRKAGGELVRRIRLFDLYRGESIPVGTKSLAYALSYQATDRTLADKEIDKAHKKIEDRLKHVLKAQIRGQEDQK